MEKAALPVVLTGEVIDGPGLIDEELFEMECERLWKEAVTATGCDPYSITERVGEVARDFGAKATTMPRQFSKEINNKPAGLPIRKAFQA